MVKKTMKKSLVVLALAIVATFAMCLGLVMPEATAFADGEAEKSISFEVKVNEMDKVIVTADSTDDLVITYKVTANTGVDAMELVLGYDHDAFTLQSVVAKDDTALGTPTLSSGTGDKIVFETASASAGVGAMGAYTATGDVLITATFKVKTDTVVGATKYEFTFEHLNSGYSDSNAWVIGDRGEEYVSATSFSESTIYYEYNGSEYVAVGEGVVDSDNYADYFVESSQVSPHIQVPITVNTAEVIVKGEVGENSVGFDFTNSVERAFNKTAAADTEIAWKVTIDETSSAYTGNKTAIANPSDALDDLTVTLHWFEKDKDGNYVALAEKPKDVGTYYVVGEISESDYWIPYVGYSGTPIVLDSRENKNTTYKITEKEIEVVYSLKNEEYRTYDNDTFSAYQLTEGYETITGVEEGDTVVLTLDATSIIDQNVGDYSYVLSLGENEKGIVVALKAASEDNDNANYKIKSVTGTFTVNKHVIEIGKEGRKVLDEDAYVLFKDGSFGYNGTEHQISAEISDFYKDVVSVESYAGGETGCSGNGAIHVKDKSGETVGYYDIIATFKLSDTMNYEFKGGVNTLTAKLTITISGITEEEFQELLDKFVKFYVVDNDVSRNLAVVDLFGFDSRDYNGNSEFAKVVIAPYIEVSGITADNFKGQVLYVKDGESYKLAEAFANGTTYYEKSLLSTDVSYTFLGNSPATLDTLTETYASYKVKDAGGHNIVIEFIPIDGYAFADGVDNTVAIVLDIDKINLTISVDSYVEYSDIEPEYTIDNGTGWISGESYGTYNTSVEKDLKPYVKSTYATTMEAGDKYFLYWTNNAKEKIEEKLYNYNVDLTTANGKILLGEDGEPIVEPEGPYIENPDPEPWIPNPEFPGTDPDNPVPPYIPNPEYGPEKPYIPDPKNPDGDPIPNPEYPEPPYIPNPDYPDDPNVPPFIPNPDYPGYPDNMPEPPYIPDPEHPDGPYIPNPDYPEGPKDPVPVEDDDLKEVERKIIIVSDYTFDDYIATYDGSGYTLVIKDKDGNVITDSDSIIEFVIASKDTVKDVDDSGNYTATLTLKDGKNYVFKNANGTSNKWTLTDLALTEPEATYTDAVATRQNTVTISEKELTIEIVYTTDTTATFSLTGFVNGETEAVEFADRVYSVSGSTNGVNNNEYTTFESLVSKQVTCENANNHNYKVIAKDILNVYVVSFANGTYDKTVSAGEDPVGMPDTQYIFSDHKATKPTEDPTLKHYKFVEWQLDSAKYEFESAVSSNLSIVAKWNEREQYKITFQYRIDEETTWNKLIEVTYYDDDVLHYGTELVYLTDYVWFLERVWYTDEALTNKVADKITLTEDTIVYGHYKFDIGLGDVDASGEINTNDITLYREWIVGGYEMTVIEKGSEFATVSDASFDKNKTYFLKRVADLNAKTNSSATLGDDSLDIRDVSTQRMALVGGYGFNIVKTFNVTQEEIIIDKVYEVTTVEELSNCLSAGQKVKLVADITDDAVELVISNSTKQANINLNGKTLTLKSIRISVVGNKAITLYNGTVKVADELTLSAPDGDLIINAVTFYKGDKEITLQAGSSSLHFQNTVAFKDKNEARVNVKIMGNTHVVIESEATLLVANIESVGDGKVSLENNSEKEFTVNVMGDFEISGENTESIVTYAVYTENAGEKVYYESLIDAVSEVNNDTIYLASDLVGDGVQIAGDKNLIIDLNSHKYTVNNNTVGSPNTETQAFHIEKGATVTIKNGTIDSTNVAKMLLQNYADLTLDGVTLDGTKLNNEKVRYTLSNNFGTVNIRNSKIIARDTDVAFDLWYGMDSVNKAYDDGITVNVDANSEIVGKVEYGAKRFVEGWLDKTVLNVENGAKWCKTLTISNNLKLDTPWIITDKITIDLNGKTIKASDGYDGYYLIKADGEDAEVTIIDSVGTGKIDSNARLAPHAIPLTSANGAKLVINGGNYYCYGEGECVYANGGTVEINGGTYKVCEGETVKDLLNVQNSHVVTDIQVKGGTFYGKTPAEGDDYLKGNFVANGYKVEVNDDGSYTVVKDND